MGVSRRTSQRQRQRAAKSSRDSAAMAGAEQTSTKEIGSTSQTAVPSLALGFNEVFKAIESLYADELKPFGRILRKRVAERTVVAAGSENNPHDVDMKQLREMCEESACLHVGPEEGGDWSVLIVGRPECFVDVYSSMNPYPEGMWGAAAAYFQLLSGEEMRLPGGRYSCAQMLLARGLAFLRGRSLGQVCHIVQLAISQKKLLGYLNGAVVPYAFSQSMMKEQCAQLNAPCTLASAQSDASGVASRGENTLTIATWETARQHLCEILEYDAQSNADDVGKVPLSNVKRLFRSRFRTELSETKLGHSKLSELLQDKRFSDICTVQLHGNGYIVVQVPPVAVGEQPGTELVQEESLVDVEKMCWPSTHGDLGSLVQRTFIHAKAPPPTPPPNARRRSASLPKDVGSGKHISEPECQPLGFMLTQQDRAEDSDSTVDSSRQSSRALEDPVKVLLRDLKIEGIPMTDAGDSVEDQPCHRLQFCPDEPLVLEDVASAILESAPLTQTPTCMYIHPSARLQFCPDEPLVLEDVASAILESAPLTQTPTCMYTHPSAPRWPCLSPSLFAGDSCEDINSKWDNADGGEYYQQLAIFPDEQLDLEEPDFIIDSGAPTKTSTNKWPCLSPSLLFSEGCVGSIALSKVQNTFIHSPLPPPTPLRVGASRRSRSLPKNVGSDKNMWEATCQSLGCSHVPSVHQERARTASDCLATPNVYSDFIPPSPALTASPNPIYGNGNLGWRPINSSSTYGDGSFLPDGTEPQVFMSDGYWSTLAFCPANVISLASLLQNQ